MNHRLHPARALALCALILALAACAGAENGNDKAEASGPQPQTGLATIGLEVGGVSITVEVADTHESREKGLMYRTELPGNHGMLFVYPRAFPLSFWMKNTPLPLDIAFIDRSGFIIDIQSMQAMSTDSHRAPSPVPYALEMKRDWFEANGVEVGDRVTGLPSPRTAE